MTYVLDYNICAIVFLAIIASRYYFTRQFPAAQSRMFSFVLATGFLDVFLDTVSAYTIMNASVLPVWVNYLYNTAFYMLQVIFPLMLCYYVMYLGGLFTVKRHRILVLMALPALLTDLYILSNLFTHFIFKVENGVFLHENGYIFLFFEILFYVGASVILLTLRRKLLSDRQYATVMMCVFFIIAALVIQYCLPHYLLTSLSIAIALILIYFIRENPENMIDRATGAFSGEAFAHYLRETLEMNKPLQFICVELDDMERFNRFFGFNAGNEAIRATAEYLRTFSDSIWVFRLTGVRFCVITDKRDEHRLLLQTISSRFTQPWEIGSSSKPMLSATICHMPELKPAETEASVSVITDLIELSFAEAECLGHGAVSEIGEADLAKLCRYGIIEQALRAGLESGEGFEVCFQPIYSMGAGRFTRAEALLRFSNPVLGPIEPAEFIPIAERAGFMSQLDRLVLQRVCAFVAEERPRETLGLEELEINLSAVDFMSTYLSQTLIATMKAYSIDPGYLCFEFTESVAAASWSDLHASIGELAERGFRFALDNVSALAGSAVFPDVSRIAALPLSSVKLGRGLFDISDAVSAGAVRDRGRVLLNGAASIFRELGLTVIARGVESRDLLPALSDAGIDLVQGFCYARPMPVGDFVKFIKKSNG